VVPAEAPPVPGAGAQQRGGAGVAPAPVKAFRVAVPWPYLIGALVVVAAISVYPLWELIRMAFSNVGPTNLIGSWKWTGFGDISSAVRDPALRKSALITLKLTAMLLFSDLVIGFIVASVLLTRSRATSVLMSVMTFVWALPPLVSGSVWKFLLNTGGPVNALLGDVGLKPVDWLASPGTALWSVGFVTAWAALPFATMILRGAMLAVPREMIEAAAVDGAGYWQIQTRIVLPQLRPTMAILAVLAVLYSFQGFNFIFALTAGGPGTATQNIPYLAYQDAFTNFDLSAGAAVSLLAMGLIALLAIPYAISVRREQLA
jgi:multiple sugar transport system permease protein